MHRELLEIARDRLLALLNQLRDDLAKTPGADLVDDGLIDLHLFLERVYRLAAEKRVHSAGDTIFDFVQNRLASGDFAGCGRLLAAIDISRLKDSPALLVTFLSTTFTARKKLSPLRDEYYQKVFSFFVDSRGKAGAKALLGKYR